jgi:hypothetical protein
MPQAEALQSIKGGCPMSTVRKVGIVIGMKLACVAVFLIFREGVKNS